MLVASHIVTALQSIVARNVDPLKSGVVSICVFHAGEALNVIPETAHLEGTARTLAPEVRDLLERRVVEVAEATARLHGATAKVALRASLSRDQQPRAADRVRGVRGGAGGGRRQGRHQHAAADGRGGLLVHAGGAARRLHLRRQRQHRRRAPPQAYDFNDDALPVGVSYWARLVETAMPA